MALQSIERLAKEIAKLPGIGEKTAFRLAMHFFYGDDIHRESFASALKDLKTDVVFCRVCGNLSTNELCDICSDEKRDRSILCVVARYADLLAIEQTGEYRGRYHLLHGLIAPIKGVSIRDIRLKELFERVDKETPSEIILAFDAGIEGDTTANYIVKMLAGKQTVSRIAYGISMGSDIENADVHSLSRSMMNRTVLR
ncbi:MAG: recombination protein RecR [Spirochaetes bacterium]|nr:recombination protein RecR [Spirochaetota bacterium]